MWVVLTFCPIYSAITLYRKMRYLLVIFFCVSSLCAYSIGTESVERGAAQVSLDRFKSMLESDKIKEVSAGGYYFGGKYQDENGELKDFEIYYEGGLEDNPFVVEALSSKGIVIKPYHMPEVEYDEEYEVFVFYDMIEFVSTCLVIFIIALPVFICGIRGAKYFKLRIQEIESRR